ncbi:hypothetical protein ACLB2K_066881 [Fragaria x ananassa]
MGVRQGDPLSPLLFCLAEEVLSRGLADLATQNKIKCFKAPGGVTPPTHVLFVDDVMIFTQGRFKYLRNLMSFMEEYAQNFGQAINTTKSQLFLSKSAIPRQMRITNILGINMSVFPFTYLGVPIFVGRPKSAFLLPIADRIEAKLSSWKGRLLSQAGRLQLIESVIQSQLLYSFQVYEWSQELIKKVQRWVCTFIHNREWRIPWSFKRAHQEVAEVISSLPLPAFDMPNHPVWAMETSGILTARSAYCMLAEDLPVVNWGMLPFNLEESGNVESSVE